MHRLEKPADSTHSSKCGLSPHVQIERHVKLHSFTQDEALPSWPNIRGSLKSPCNSRIPPQLEKNHVAPPSSQDEALGRYSVSREVPRSILKYKTVLGTLDATPKVP